MTTGPLSSRAPSTGSSRSRCWTSCSTPASRSTTWSRARRSAPCTPWPSLKRRADYANSLDLDVVLSIHTNAVGRSIRGPSQPARGITVFTSPGETNADGYAAAIAGCVSGVGLRSRGTREANFYMLRRTRSPAVLVEGGFFTSLDDVQLLQDRTYRVHLASCYVRGLLQHHAERS
ncbi:MAG: N-acetylmuramoyl-L-alanine amidase family protein [Planctomycetota bacterium]